jgi:hypothetical protein
MSAPINVVAAAAATGWSIPDVVWAAVISSVLTFTGVIAGVVLANWNSRTQLRTQLKDAAEEASEAREFAMRRDVYLTAVEAIVRSIHILFSIGNLELEDSEISRTMMADAGHIAKIQVVAHKSTLRAITDYQGTLAEGLAQLWPKRWELQSRWQTIGELEQLMNAQAADKDRWVEMMKQANVQQPPDAALMAAIRLQFDAAERLRLDLAQRHAPLASAQADGLFGLLDECLQQGMLLQERIPAALVAARAELGLAIDEAALTQIFLDASQRGPKSSAIPDNPRSST